MTSLKINGMDKMEANERIVLSRHTLARYRRVMDDGKLPMGARDMIREELFILDTITAAFPDMEDKLVLLVQGWSGLLSRLEMKLH
jgi:hypothetical protein